MLPGVSLDVISHPNSLIKIHRGGVQRQNCSSHSTNYHCPNIYGPNYIYYTWKQNYLETVTVNIQSGMFQTLLGCVCSEFSQHVELVFQAEQKICCKYYHKFNDTHWKLSSSRSLPHHCFYVICSGMQVKLVVAGVHPNLTTVLTFSSCCYESDAQNKGF